MWRSQLSSISSSALSSDGRTRTKASWHGLCCRPPTARAQLMLARSERPMNPGAQDMIFYLYAENVEQYRCDLAAKGLAVGEMQYPF